MGSPSPFREQNVNRGRKPKCICGHFKYEHKKKPQKLSFYLKIAGWGCQHCECEEYKPNIGLIKDEC